MQPSDTAAPGPAQLTHPMAQAAFDPEPIRAPGAALPTRKILLGEELPIFCEKCGYALHGLAQQVCAQCAIRQFHCPECGHHQPINTLRPAAQKFLGRIRASSLLMLVFFKLNFFGWLLVAWVSLGYEMSYSYEWISNRSGGGRGETRLITQEFSSDTAVGFTVFGLAYGMVGRMLLLRWRRGYLIGAVLAALVFIALVMGAYWRLSWLMDHDPPITGNVPSPLGGDFMIMVLLAVGALLLGASTVWGIWVALVSVFLPRRAGRALLDWQANQSTRAVSDLSRE